MSHPSLNHSTNQSFLGYRQQLSNLIDDQDFYVTIIATPTANQFQENCLYESNV